MGSRGTWPLNLRLLHWNRSDAWTLDQACIGTLITGATGSGKTSGPFQYVMRSLLRIGCGGIFLCAKQDAADEYISMCRSEGRMDDVMRFRENEHSFNFLTHEASHDGGGRGIVENVVATLLEASQIAARGKGGQSDPFFEAAMTALLRHCVEVVHVANGDIDLFIIAKIVATLPKSAAAAEEIQESFALQMLAAAERRAVAEKQPDISLARNYFTQEWPHLAPQTSSSIAITLSTLLDAFLRFPLRVLHLGTTTCSPDDALAGKIILIDVPVTKYSIVGKFSGVIWKTCLQRALLRRPAPFGSDRLRPVFIAADEAQFFATTGDSLFQTVARSARGISVYATQNIENFHAELGGDATGRSRVDSLLGNLQTRLACQNTAEETNRWHAEAVGRIIVRRSSYSSGTVPAVTDMQWVPSFFNALTPSVSESETIDYDLLPRIYSTLRTGGHSEGNKVEAILTSSGRRFRANRKRWIKVTFNQNIVEKMSSRFFQKTARIASRRH